MLTSDQMHDLINQYAPIIILNANEKYFLTSAEQYISNCNVIDTADGPGLTLKTRNDQTMTGDMDDAKTYVNVKIYPDQGYVDIQYWFLYAYNGPGTLYVKVWVPASVWPPKGPHYESLGDYVVTPCGQHEGDWEHVTARVNLSDGSLQKIYFAQHKAGVWLDLHLPINMAQSRISFYASKFGHAAYPSADRNYTETHKYGVVEFRLVNDTESPGMSKDMRDHYQIIGIQSNGKDVSGQYNDYVKPDWMELTGRWGEVITQRPDESAISIPFPGLSEFGVNLTIKDIMQEMGLYDQCEQEAGPQPPWSKDSWQGGEN